MKTKEEIKQEIVRYLTKTSEHTFIKPKSTFKYYESGGKWEHDWTQFTYFKVIKIGGDFFYLENNNGQNTPTTYKLWKVDIDSKINSYDQNAKCVISHGLFLGKGMRSIRSSKFRQREIQKIISELKT